MRRLKPLVLTVMMSLIFCVSAAAIPLPEPSAVSDISAALAESHVMAAENDRFSLYVKLDDCQIVLLEKQSGRQWLSSPGSDEAISSEMAQQIKSLLVVSFLDSKFNIVTVNSFTESVTNESYEIKRIQNGLKITYDFQKENQRFKIPVQIKLFGEYVEASVLFNGITEYGDSRVTEIDLLPFFGAGRSDEDGYLLIPDGSGALVSFSENNRNAEDYRQRVYGSDPAVGLMLKSAEPQESIGLPVFGIKKGNGAFLAVIHEGDADSSVFATNNSQDSPFAAVGASFHYHQYDVTGIRDKLGQFRQVPEVQEKPNSVSPSVRYYFLDGEDANYSGMARKYRSYLEEAKGFTMMPASEISSTGLAMYGMTQKPSTFLGIPITKKVTVTSFSDAQKILKKLQEQGVENPDVFLYGYENGGFQQKYSAKVSYDSRTGGKKGYLSLLKNAPDAQVFTAVDLMRDYAGSLFKSRYIRSLNEINIVRRQSLPGSGEWDFDGPAWRYLRPALFSKNADKFVNSITESDHAGVLFLGLGRELYSDFDDRKAPGRGRTIEAHRQAAEFASEKAAAAVEGGSVYMADTADILTNIPTASSGFDIFSEDVPFYAMVLHGYVQMTSKPVNRIADRDTVIPGMIAAGIRPYWQLTAADPSDLKDTPLDFLYNTKAEGWITQIAEKAGAYQKSQQALVNVPIRSHKRQGKLEIFTYENGTVIIGNNGDTDAEYDGARIPSREVVRLN